jgi:hypothetical protein
MYEVWANRDVDKAVNMYAAYTSACTALDVFEEVDWNVRPPEICTCKSMCAVNAAVIDALALLSCYDGTFVRASHPHVVV